jgi:hypothetical protein
MRFALENKKSTNHVKISRPKKMARVKATVLAIHEFLPKYVSCNKKE